MTAHLGATKTRSSRDWVVKGRLRVFVIFVVLRQVESVTERANGGAVGSHLTVLFVMALRHPPGLGTLKSNAVANYGLGYPGCQVLTGAASFDREARSCCARVSVNDTRSDGFRQNKKEGSGATLAFGQERKVGGRQEARTLDLRIANAALSQLS